MLSGLNNKLIEVERLSVLICWNNDNHSNVEHQDGEPVIAYLLNHGANVYLIFTDVK